jgi:DNA-binding response OmpR family regulator
MLTTTNGAPKRKILLIDDDRLLRSLLRHLLNEAGYATYEAANSLEGLQQQHQPDLVVLDVMMPALDGWQTCARLRARSTVPILMLTALQGAAHTIRGLEGGADDYLEKPFDPGVLLARVKALLRRVALLAGPDKNHRYDDGYLRLDLEAHQVTVGEQPVHLSRLEYALLAYLFRHAGRIMTHEQILQHLWAWEPEASLNNLQLIVTRLRKKIEVEPKQPRYLLTEHGLGYRFQK